LFGKTLRDQQVQKVNLPAGTCSSQMAPATQDTVFVASKARRGLKALGRLFREKLVPDEQAQAQGYNYKLA